MDRPIEEWDIFVSHASEDKAAFVEPLAQALSAFGLRVWYDNFTLKIGDSLSRSIDIGLSKSDYGLVVLSPAFLSKRWPEYELRGLTAREITGKKVILPIWHNVTYQEILEFSPPLADKLAIKTEKLSPLQIAVSIIEAIRPDIFTRILRRVAYYKMINNASRKFIDPRELHPSPIRHKELPPELVGRIRLIRASLLGAYDQSMEFWLDGFKRDAHPSNEVAYWEHTASIYREYLSMFPSVQPSLYPKIFGLIFAVANSVREEELKARAEGLPAETVGILKELYSSTVPPYDFKEETPLASVEGKKKEDAEIELDKYDKEHFPNDLPEALIREIIGAEEWQNPA